jgi:hypothetical protein
MLLILFPFFQVNDPASYATSGIHKIITCRKDVFYRLLSNSNINWWQFNYSITKQLIKKVNKTTTNHRKTLADW